MMIKIKHILLLIMFVAMPAMAQNYDAMWKKVSKLEEKDRTSSALNATDKIYSLARKNGNELQMCLAALIRKNLNERLSEDSLYTELRKFEALTNSLKDQNLKAIMMLHLANAYDDNVAYFSEDNTVDYSWPYEKWTRKMFEEKATSVRKEVLALASSFAGVPDIKYIDLIELGDELPFHHDLLSLIGYNICNDYKLKDVALNTMLKIYRSDIKYVDAEIWIKLRILSENNAKTDDYEKMFNDEKYKNAELRPEIYLSLIKSIFNSSPERALELCDEAIAKYPKYSRINNIKIQRENLLMPSLHVFMKDRLYPNTETSIRASWKNLKDLELKWYKVNVKSYAEYDKLTEKIYNDERIKKVKANSTFFRSDKMTFDDIHKFAIKDSSFVVKAPGYGIYIVEPVANGVSFNQVCEVNVSAFTLLYESLPNDKLKVIPVDMKTGHIVPNANLYSKNSSDYRIEKTEDYFEVKLNDEKKWGTSSFRAESDEDKFMSYESLYGGFGSFGRSLSKIDSVVVENATLFADRSIYRPSQTVHIGGFTYKSVGEEYSVLADKPITVEMLIGGKVKDKKNAKTDAYGGYGVDFVLPSSVPNNMALFEVKDSNDRTLKTQNVIVDEYKLPEFHVDIDTLKVGYTWGDTVTFSGVAKTFSGMPVANARVITSFESNKNDTIFTDENGRFSSKMKIPEHRREVFKRWYAYYCSNYIFNASVTSESGETEHGELAIYVSSLPIKLSVNFPKKVTKESLAEMSFEALNVLNIPQKVDVEYSVYNSKLIDGKYDKDGKALLTGSFQSNTTFFPMDIFELKSGRYTIEATCCDTIKTTKDFVLFSLEDAKPVEDSPLWIYQTSENIGTDSSAQLQVGTTFTDAWIYCDVLANGKVVDCQIIKLDNSLQTLTFNYKEVYGDGLKVNIALVKDGKDYIQSVTFKKIKPRGNLKLQWNTFRDKLVPGQKETWKLKVTNEDGTPADAQILATMYDKSLDMILKHRSLLFHKDYSWLMPYSSWRIPVNYVRSVGNNYIASKLESISPYEADELLMSYALFYSLSHKVPGVSNVLHISENSCTDEDVAPVAKIAGVKVAKEDAFWNSSKSSKVMVRGTSPMMAKAAAPTSIVEEEIYDLTSSDVASSVPTIAARTNLSETAFFYPTLQTDANGIATISFTLPEGLTTWKCMAIAHNKSLDAATITSEAVAQKQIMIKPQMPRFLRKGDKAQITAMLYNQTSKSLKGTAYLTIFDPLTEKSVITKTVKVVLATAKPSSVTFSFDTPNEDRLYACKIIVVTAKGSDGEQQYLPVLSDETLLTESLPFIWKEKGENIESLDSLFSGQKSIDGKYSMTVQFAANPIWYAVQALPSMKDDRQENALSAVTSYYATSLAQYIAKSNPKIQKAVEVWKQDKTGVSLMSALKQNADLREIPLEESLWEDDADEETLRKQRLAELFDQNKVDNALNSTISKLKKYQNIDGGFSWCKEMKSSYFVTYNVANIMTRLLKLRKTIEANSDELAILRNAFSFIDKEVRDDIQQMEKDKMLYCNEEYIEYYYLRTMSKQWVTYTENASFSMKKINTLLDKQYKSPKEFSRFGQAVMASTFFNNGKKQEAKDLCIALLENTVQRKLQGRYFDGRFYYWGCDMRMNVQTYIIEALNEWLKSDITAVVKTLPDGTTYKEALAQMRVWLLNQKRSNNWDNPISSANAVYALICNEDANLSAETDDNALTVCGHAVNMKSEIAALGFFNDKWTATEPIDKNMTVQKANDGISWGAVYAQYKVNNADVKQKGDELTIEREYFVERTISGKVQSIPLSKTTLSVGDKIVQHLTIVSKVNMKYVQLEMPRAACSEPVAKHSGYRWNSSIGYYEVIKDTKSQLFIEHLPKGRYTIDTEMYIDRRGTYSTGVATIRCAYDTAYGAHTSSTVLQVR